MLRWVLSNPASWTGRKGIPSGRSVFRSVHTASPSVSSSEWHSSESSAALRRVAASRTASALNDALGTLNAEERKRIYSVYRPSLRPSPSDYLEAFRVARTTLERSAMQRCSDATVTDILALLSTFCALWAKPLDPRSSATYSQGGKGEEWMRCDDRVFHAVVASGLAATPALVTFRVVWHLMMVLRDSGVRGREQQLHQTHRAMHRGTDEEQLLRLLLSSSSQETLSRTAEVLPRDVSEMLSCFEWCAATHESRLLEGRNVLRASAAASSAPTSPTETVAKWVTLVTSAEVVSVIVSATIELGMRECKEAALSLLDRYFKMRIAVGLPPLPAEHVALLTRATESAATAGDSELVTRIIFSVFRARGEVVTSCTSTGQGNDAGTRTSQPSSLLWPWMGVGSGAAASLNEAAASAAQYEQAVGTLLSCAVRAACVDGGVSRGVRMFDALRVGASFHVAAAMGLELLRVHVAQSVRDSQHRFSVAGETSAATDKRRVVIAQSGYAVLSAILACAPPSPTDEDKKMICDSILACMQLHYAFHPIVIPVLRRNNCNVALSRIELTTEPMSFASCEHHPARTLELLERLPSASVMADDATVLALASAAALRDKSLLARLLGTLTRGQAVPLRLRNFIGDENPCPKATVVAAMFLFGLLSCGTDVVAEGWLSAFHNARPVAVVLSVATLQIVAASKPFANPEPLVALSEWLQAQLPTLESDASSVSDRNNAALGCVSLERMAACAVVAALQQQSWIGEGVSSSFASARAHLCQRQIVLRDVKSLLFDVPVLLPSTDLYFNTLSEAEGGGWTLQERDVSGALSQCVVQHVVVVHHSALQLAERKGATGLLPVLDVFKSWSSQSTDGPSVLVLIPWQVLLSAHRAAAACFAGALRESSPKGLRIAVVADARNIHLDQPSSLAAVASSVSVPRLLDPDAELDQVVVRVARRVASCVRRASSEGTAGDGLEQRQCSVHVWWENDPNVPQLLSFMEGSDCRLQHVSSSSVQQHRALDSVRQLLHVPPRDASDARKAQPSPGGNLQRQQLQRGSSDGSVLRGAQRSGGLLRSSQKQASS